MLSEGAIVVFNCLGEVTLLLIGSTNPSECPGEEWLAF